MRIPTTLVSSVGQVCVSYNISIFAMYVVRSRVGAGARVGSKYEDGIRIHMTHVDLALESVRGSLNVSLASIDTLDERCRKEV